MQKKPVVLLEILIAITLITLTLIPLIGQPMQFHKAEKERIKKVEERRITAWTYTEIQEKFLKGEFRWEQIPPLKTESKIYQLSPTSLVVPPMANESVTRHFTMRTLKEKEHEGKIIRLVAICLTVGSSTTTYRLMVEKSLFF